VFRRAVIVLLALFFALGTAACGSDDDGSSAGESATPTTTETDTETATTGQTETGAETETTETDAETETEANGDDGSSGSGSGESASATGEAATRLPVDRVLFRSRDNAVFCGLKRAGDRDLLSCWATPTGYTLRLTPRGGAPRGGVVVRNRGLRPPRAGAIRVLRGRQRFRRGPYTCKVDRNVVRCVNAARHGFQLGKSFTFRF
jgi:hypothetical protein